jgi:hypothetical protein
MTTIIEVHNPSIDIYIKHFIKQINIPVNFEIISSIMKGGTTTSTNTGNSNYFQSFLQFFSQEKKTEKAEKTYLDKLFYSGEGPSVKKKETMIPNQKETIPITTDYKIKLTTPNHPDINLQNALKGTKFDYLLERNKNKDLKILWI